MSFLYSLCSLGYWGFGALIGIPSPASAASVERPMRSWLDVPYLGEESSPEQRLDIWAPVVSEPVAPPRPVVLYIHGGGWFKGDKSRIASKPEWFVSQGFVFVSANYRLLPRVRHPDNARDVAQAIHWLRSNLAQYGGDPDAIFLIGHSSGAHLVSLVGTDERHMRAAGETLESLSGIIALDTNAFDLPRLIRESPEENRDFYLTVFGRRLDLLQDASPISHIRPNKQAPPFLILVAGDEPTKQGQVDRFSAALRASDVGVEVISYPDETHGSINRGIGTENHSPSGAVLDFLHRNSN